MATITSIFRCSEPERWLKSVLSGSPAGSSSSFGSLHFSGEYVPAPTASPAPVASSVLTASPSCPVLNGSAVPLLNGSAVEGLNVGQQAVLDCIKDHEGINVPRISEGTNIPSKSIEHHIKVLIERNLIEHRGSKKTGGYYAK